MRNQIEDEKPHQESPRGKSSLVGPLLPAGDSLSGRIKQADGRLEGREFDSKLGSRSRTHLIQKTTASLCARGRGRIRIGDQCEQYVDRITSCVVVPSVITDCNKAFSRLSHVNFLSFIKVEQALVQRLRPGLPARVSMGSYFCPIAGQILPRFLHSRDARL